MSENDLISNIKDAIEKINSNKESICTINLMYDNVLLMKSILEDKDKLKELDDMFKSGNCVCSFISEGTMIPKIIIESAKRQ